MPPPPPPPPPAAADEPDVDQYRALYDFAGQEGEINLTKGDVVELLEQDANGACFGVRLTATLNAFPQVGGV